MGTVPAWQYSRVSADGALGAARPTVRVVATLTPKLILWNCGLTGEYYTKFT